MQNQNATNQGASVEKAADSFNQIRFLRGEYVSMATSDLAGKPNVAPIGSMRWVDENTVHVLQVGLPRTFNNLKQNPRAVFSVCKRRSAMNILSLFRHSGESNVLGYRISARLEQVREAPEVVAEELQFLLKRVPWPARTAFRRFCEQNLKRLWVFSVEEVRDIQ